MRKYFLLSLVLLLSCSQNQKYNPDQFYDDEEQNTLLTKIVSYIADAPPSTLLKDRFRPEHNMYYKKLREQFELVELFIGRNGIHYYLVLRPTTAKGQVRAAVGTFSVDGKLNLVNFRESFVTPNLPTDEAKEKSGFLFDKMVKGQLSDYVNMKTYVQWPNEISYYDTIVYQWRLKKEMVE